MLHKKVHKRGILALEAVAVQLSLGIESKHLVHEPNDRAGDSVAKFNDCVHHTHSLSGEARYAVAFGIIEHSRELRVRQPVQGVVWTNKEYPW